MTPEPFEAAERERITLGRRASQLSRFENRALDHDGYAINEISGLPKANVGPATVAALLSQSSPEPEKGILQ